MRAFAALLLAAGASLAAPAFAAEAKASESATGETGAEARQARAWRIDPDASNLQFVAMINGGPLRGVFHDFAGQGRFDPDALEAAELTFTVKVGSVDAGQFFVTAIVKTNDWLSASDYPEARYVLENLSPLGGDRYRATGVLTMKEIALPVTGELDVTFPDGVAHSVGRIVFDRSAFRVGVGFTSLFVDIGDEVAVEFDLIATPEE